MLLLDHWILQVVHSVALASYDEMQVLGHGQHLVNAADFSYLTQLCENFLVLKLSTIIIFWIICALQHLCLIRLY